MTREALLLLLGVSLTALSGVPGSMLGRRDASGQWIAVCLNVVGGICGFCGAALSLSRGYTAVYAVPTPIEGADFSLGVDSLSAFFLLPTFLISALGAIYGLGYWQQADHPDNGRKLRLFYGLLSSALAVLQLARNSVTFLVGWEAMAVSAFLLVSTEDQDEEVRTAGWHYLAASHAATLGLFLLFGMLYGVTGTFDLEPLRSGQISPTVATVAFLLALFAFGMKAGIMPLHFWLPSAHAMAPSHVSAIMSGVLIKTGVYGLLRITSLLPAGELWWGPLLLTLGAVSAVLGITMSLAQHDIKRLLAYSSVENIGIIFVGLGLAVLGRNLGQPTWVMLGMAGCLLHIWNHALFKSLLFYCAGSIIHATGTRRIDLMGGLAKRMPQTSTAFLVGTTAVCGLPPLNGFVSEYLIYLGLFQTMGFNETRGMPAAAFAAPALALTGALALACFVKAYGIVFLGVSRTVRPTPEHESPTTMTAPLRVLALCCLAIGLGPVFLAHPLERAAAVWADVPHGEFQLAPAASLSQVSIFAVVLAAALACGLGLLNWVLHSRPLARAATWGCGYLAPTPRMQYSGSSWAQFLSSLFTWVLRPKVEWPNLQGIFPRSGSFQSSVSEIMLDRLLLPLFGFVARVFYWFRVVQYGHVQIYLVYIVVILVALFFWY